jgi:hypothetical protein
MARSTSDGRSVWAGVGTASLWMAGSEPNTCDKLLISISGGGVGSIRVQAMGEVTGAPARVSADDGVLAVFVFDPFHDLATAGMAHACEVRCRDARLVDEVLRQGILGALVAVSGGLTVSRAGEPVEDELCAVRVAIEAQEVRFPARAEPRA